MKITKFHDIADLFNKLFIYAPKQVIDGIQKIHNIDFDHSLNKNLSSMCVLPFTNDEILNVFSNLKDKASSRPDDLLNNNIKECNNNLVKSINL